MSDGRPGDEDDPSVGAARYDRASRFYSLSDLPMDLLGGARRSARRNCPCHPVSRVNLTLAADNPGPWLLHCHTAYDAEAGMMARLDYT